MKKTFVVFLILMVMGCGQQTKTNELPQTQNQQTEQRDNLPKEKKDKAPKEEGASPLPDTEEGSSKVMEYVYSAGNSLKENWITVTISIATLILLFVGYKYDVHKKTWDVVKEGGHKIKKVWKHIKEELKVVPPEDENSKAPPEETKPPSEHHRDTEDVEKEREKEEEDKPDIGTLSGSEFLPPRPSDLTVFDLEDPCFSYRKPTDTGYVNMCSLDYMKCNSSTFQCKNCCRLATERRRRRNEPKPDSMGKNWAEGKPMKSFPAHREYIDERYFYSPNYQKLPPFSTSSLFTREMRSLPNDPKCYYLDSDQEDYP